MVNGLRMDGSEWENRTSVPLTLNPRKFTLTAGSHTIRFRTRDANSILDAIVVTNDLAYVPQQLYSWRCSPAGGGGT